MQERDPFSLGACARHLIHELDTRLPAFFQRALEIRDGKANVVNPCPSLRDEPADGRVSVERLQQLHQRSVRVQSNDAGAIGVVDRNRGEAEHVAIERELRVNGREGDAHVRDPRRRPCWIGH